MDIDFIYREVVCPVERVQLSLTPQEARDLRTLAGSLSLNMLRDILPGDEEQANRVRDLCTHLYLPLYDSDL